MTEQSIGELASKIVDPWAWWQAALQDPNGIGRGSLTISEAHPEQGYYRTRDKGGDWEPVAIFYPEGSRELVAYRNGREVAEIERLWTFCCRHPITYDAYQRAIDGRGWADEPPKPTIGDNSGDEDPFEAIRVEMMGEVEQAREFIKQPITTKEAADKVGIWTTRVRKLGSRADDQRKVEKQPHLDAGRAVDDRWRELTDLAKEVTADLKDALKPYLQEQRRQEQERAREAAEEAERKRQEAMRAENDEAREKALEAAKEAEESAKPMNAQAGRTGAKVSIRVQKVGIVTDYQKAATALADMKHPDMIKLIDQLANRAAKNAMPFDGMEIKEQETVV
ncbi:hypothetical protein [Oceaniradius stylonematis]|uniref:hypothetical protein n=1 Tax=Oceaniradius stylonematis TaxID=2184161 RepID=UPI00273F97CD|nr:hypothetical protein [Oceaniradius stylonematis]